MKVDNNIAISRCWGFQKTKGAVNYTKIQNAKYGKYSDSLTFSANYNQAMLKRHIDKDKISSSGITNLHVIDNDCVRGETLSSRKNRKFLEFMKNLEVKIIILLP